MSETKSLRVAVIAPPWFEIPPNGYGGIEWLCFWLVRGLIEKGHKVTLVAAGQNHTEADFLQSFREPPSNRLGDPLPEVVQAAAAAKMLEGLEFDVVHDHSLAGPLLARSRKFPTIVTAHGPVGGDLGDYYARLGKTVQLVAISKAQRDDAPKLNWAATVYNAIPVDEYPFLEDKEDFVLFLGRMSPEKGAHLAIEAAREARWPIVVAGKCIEKAERDYFESFIRPLLGPDVQWVGQADAIMKKDLLSRARCLVFPITWREPFGIVMPEAMACGTPVVALNDGSVPEIVAHEETGYIVDEPSGLAEAIKRADLIDPRACRDRARALFDISKMVNGYEKVYRRAIG